MPPAPNKGRYAPKYGSNRNKSRKKAAGINKISIQLNIYPVSPARPGALSWVSASRLNVRDIIA